MKEVELLIPHRKPFLFIDQLVTASREEIIGTMVFSDSDQLLTGSFPEFNFVPGMALMEALAQCGGAGIRKLQLASGYFALANIESTVFLKGVEYQQIFKMVITNIKISSKFIKQSGIGFVNDIECVKAVWTCIKFDE
ncbi:MAG: beta-hydroxyacyl-ACP dehydratase [Chryseolinea sp.]